MLESYPGMHNGAIRSLAPYKLKTVETRMKYGFHRKLHDSGYDFYGLLCNLCKLFNMCLCLITTMCRWCPPTAAAQDSVAYRSRPWSDTCVGCYVVVRTPLRHTITNGVNSGIGTRGFEANPMLERLCLNSHSPIWLGGDCACANCRDLRRRVKISP